VTAAQGTASVKETDAREDEHDYTMSVDLSVLKALGINLYSNAAAVLSELVANAYDADANDVTISWKNHRQRVVVVDDGCGMTKKELNDRFLKVGYEKRQKEGTKSPKFERPFMGRKGIGKLSVFSIANTVTVYSTKDGVSNGLRIKVDDLEAAIRAEEDYHPEPVEVPKDSAKRGTTLLLTRLKTKRAGITAAALRKRLARRFDVINELPASKGGFKIEVNGKKITYEDRQDLKQLEFIWEFGKETLPDAVLPKGLGKRFVLKKDTAGRPEWKVTGWIGTAHRPADLAADEEAGSLKNVIVLARGRPIQEGIVEKLDFSKIFATYVTGQIEADFLDLDDGYEDIATSDRQRLMEDDERVVALNKFLRGAFIEAADQWTDARNAKESEDILDKYPPLKKWIEDRPAGQGKPARRMIGTIAGLPLDEDGEDEARADLLRAGVLSFERISLRQVSDELDQLADLSADDLLGLLGKQDIYEEALWGDILRSRLEVIEKFQGLVDEDAKERVLQKKLFENLWLLDPAFERATGSEHMEHRLNHKAPDLFPKDPDGSKIEGRIDISYATLAGKHVIVELKRFGVKIEVDPLADQGVKYVTALKSVLKQQNKPSDDLEVIFVLGHQPGVKQRGEISEEEYRESVLARCRGRVVLYNELIANAINQYSEYLEESEKIRALDDLITALKPTDGP
jgi:hypothetical protein